MDRQQKAARVLQLIRQALGDATLKYRQSDGLHEFERARGGIVHCIAYPDSVLDARSEEDLAMVATAALSLLSDDAVSASLVIRAGMFDTTLKSTAACPRAQSAIR